MDLRALVEDRLAAHADELLWISRLDRAAASNMSFETYRDAVVADAARRLARRRQDAGTPPAPGLLTIQSWQYGFTGAEGDDAAVRAAADSVYLRLQQYDDDALSSARWREHLGAFDRPDRWLALADAREAEGRTIDANACLAAARWLDPTCQPEIAARILARPPGLPARLLRQPDPDFPRLPFRERHWRAWDMKNYGRLDLPSLLRWECDANFSVRARIYRSLGQRPHPAAIQALHEGTGDPHFFARAQAIRSLGWCVDPTGVPRLRALAAEDPHPEVRRAASKAVQRIVGYWTHYGEWRAVFASEARTLATVEALAAAGLPAFAYEVAVRANFADDGPLAALAEALEPEALLRDILAREGDYHFWFADAAAAEASAGPEPDDAAALAACREPGARGFEARRVLRRREVGALAERRANMSEWT